MSSIDYHRHTLRLEALPKAQRHAEIVRFSQRIRVFHYATESEHLAPHGGGLSLKMVFRGAETFTIGSQRMRLCAGEALLMPPGVEYGSEISQRTESFSAFFPQQVYLQLGAAVCSTPGIGLETPCQTTLAPLPPVPVKADAELVASLRAAHRNLVQHNHERAAELLQEAALRLLHTSAELKIADERLALVRTSQRQELLRRLQRARTYLHDNLAQQVDLDCLAEVSHVSRFHLLRSFRRAFGLTPAQYQTQLRLERAALLLQHKQFRVSEVAFAVGYRNHSAFSRAWKQRYGCPPSAT